MSVEEGRPSLKPFFLVYRAAGARYWIILLLSTISAALDGLGIAALIPVLLGAISPGQFSADNSDLLTPLESIGFYLSKHLPIEPLASLWLVIFLIFILKSTIAFSAQIISFNLLRKIMKERKNALMRGFVGLRRPLTDTLEHINLSNLITEQANRSVQAVSNFTKSSSMMISTLVYFGYSFYINFAFGLLCMVVGAAVYLFFSFIGKEIKRYSQIQARQATTLSNDVGFISTSVSYLLGSGSINDAVSEFEISVDKNSRSFERAGRYSSVLTAFKDLILLVSLSFSVGVYYVIFKPSEFATLAIIAGLLYRALSMALGSISSYQSMLNQYGAIELVDSSLQKFWNLARCSSAALLDHPPSNFKFQSIELSSASLVVGGATVIKDLDIKIDRGEKIAVIGPSGAGKSTLVEVIMGVLSLTTGYRKVNGSLSDLPLYTHGMRVGYMPQTGGPNVGAFWRRASNPSPTENSVTSRSQHIKANILSGLLPAQDECLFERSEGAFSGGEIQRLRVLDVTSGYSEMICLDEPTSALDVHNRDLLASYFWSFPKEVTVIVIAHSKDVINGADRLVFIDRGVVRYDGPNSGPEVGRIHDLIFNERRHV